MQAHDPVHAVVLVVVIEIRAGRGCIEGKGLLSARADRVADARAADLEGHAGIESVIEIDGDLVALLADQGRPGKGHGAVVAETEQQGLRTIDHGHIAPARTEVHAEVGRMGPRRPGQQTQWACQSKARRQGCACLKKLSTVHVWTPPGSSTGFRDTHQRGSASLSFLWSGQVMPIPVASRRQAILAGTSRARVSFVIREWPTKAEAGAGPASSNSSPARQAGI